MHICRSHTATRGGSAGVIRARARRPASASRGRHAIGHGSRVRQPQPAHTKPYTETCALLSLAGRAGRCAHRPTGPARAGAATRRAGGPAARPRPVPRRCPHPPARGDPESLIPLCRHAVLASRSDSVHPSEVLRRQRRNRAQELARLREVARMLTPIARGRFTDAASAAHSATAPGHRGKRTALATPVGRKAPQQAAGSEQLLWQQKKGRIRAAPAAASRRGVAQAGSAPRAHPSAAAGGAAQAPGPRPPAASGGERSAADGGPRARERVRRAAGRARLSAQRRPVGLCRHVQRLRRGRDRVDGPQLQGLSEGGAGERCWAARPPRRAVSQRRQDRAITTL